MAASTDDITVSHVLTIGPHSDWCSDPSPINTLLIVYTLGDENSLLLSHCMTVSQVTVTTLPTAGGI